LSTPDTRNRSLGADHPDRPQQTAPRAFAALVCTIALVLAAPATAQWDEDPECHACCTGGGSCILDPDNSCPAHGGFLVPDQPCDPNPCSECIWKVATKTGACEDCDLSVGDECLTSLPQACADCSDPGSLVCGANCTITVTENDCRIPNNLPDCESF
jgi:hypothetical protein